MSNRNPNQNTEKRPPVAIVILVFFIVLAFALAVGFGSESASEIVERVNKGIARIDDLILRVFGLFLLLWAIALFIRDFDKITGPGPLASTGGPDNGGGQGTDGQEPETEVTEIRSRYKADNKENTTLIGKEVIKKKKPEKVKGSEDSGLPAPFGPYVALIKFAALLGVSGVSLFGSYELDRLDKEAYPPNGKSVAVTVRPATPPVSGGSPAIVATGAEAPNVLARWVQLIPGEPECWISRYDNLDGSAKMDGAQPLACTVGLLARMVLPAETECPDLRIDTVRSTDDAEAEWNRFGMHVRASLDPDRYPVRVCERVLPDISRLRAVEFSDGSLVSIPSAWRKETGPSKIAFFGDTGCRDDREGKCDSSWPFAQLADDVAWHRPDLVVHLGDSIYVGGDNWLVWQQQFFEPARALLAAAPWVMVRGNHEGCDDDAPRGWLFLFDYRPDGDSDTCASKDEVHQVATYALDFAEGHRLIVADSSNAYLDRELTSQIGAGGCDELGDFSGACHQYRNMFGHIEHLSKRIDKETWLATHVPVFGLEEKKEKAVLPETTAMMLAAWHAAKDSQRPDLLLSGDRHLLQIFEVDG